MGKQKQRSNGQSEIFKFQRPLMSTGEPAVLIYNRDRSREGEVPFTYGLQNTFKKLGNPLKFYARCRPLPDGQISIIKILPSHEEPSW